MSRKITTTGAAISITFIVTLLVTYAQPLKNRLFARRVETDLSSARHIKAANADLQTANGNDVENRNSSSLARQPEAIKLSRLIGGKRFKSRKGNALIVQGLLKMDGDSQHVTIFRRPAEDGEQVEVALGGGRRASLAWTRGLVRRTRAAKS